MCKVLFWKIHLHIFCNSSTSLYSCKANFHNYPYFTNEETEVSKYCNFLKSHSQLMADPAT